MKYTVALFTVCFGISVMFLLAIDALAFLLTVDALVVRHPTLPNAKITYFVNVGIYPFIMLSLILTLIVFSSSFYLCPEINDIVEFLYPGIVPILSIPTNHTLPVIPYVHTPINWDTFEDLVKNDLNKIKKRNH